MKAVKNKKDQKSKGLAANAAINDRAASPVPVIKKREAFFKPKKEEKVVQLSPEEEAAIKEAATIKARQKYLAECCTRLIFIDEAGARKEILVEDRFEQYCDLQRHLAKITPNSIKIFMIQTINGELVTPENFINSAVLRVREFPVGATTKAFQNLKPVSIKWDFLSYSGKPKDWIDTGEIRLQKIAAKAKSQRDAQKAEDDSFRIMAALEDASDGVDDSKLWANIKS